MKIVFNTSPLIFLSRLEILADFLAQPGEFYLPQAGFDEILAKNDDASRSLQWIVATQQITQQPIQLRRLADTLNQRLGCGEAEAITLALELKADYVILDDFAARREASRLGLSVKGTLAIVHKLQQDGQFTITNVDQFYQRLLTIGFRVTRSLFDQIFSP
jgi:predicted nucleic acid-binding protein